MKKIFFVLTFFVGLATTSQADGFLSDINLTGRLGWSIGGTMPVGMPATIRGINKYTLQPNLQVGVDIRKPLGGAWGVAAGLHLEDKDMKTDAKVKNYRMEITRGDQTLAGVFTGNVITNTRERMMTLPVVATLSVGERLMFKAGPYASLLLSHGFDGYAYAGYLRVDDPTGPKVELGNEENTRGEYDFRDDMRHMQFGITAGVDWHFASKIGAYAELNWGLTGIHHSSFKTIEQTLYPIFGTIGLNYKLK